MTSLLASLMAWLTMPVIGLSAVFLVCLISATVIPLAAEPAVFGYVVLHPEWFWPAMLVATAGNTAGGMIGWATGMLARRATGRVAGSIKARRAAHSAADASPSNDSADTHFKDAPVFEAAARPRRDDPRLTEGTRWGRVVHRHGAPVLVFSWLPIIGSAMCVLAGWLQLPWAACAAWMALGKFVRFTLATGLLLWVPASFWSGMLAPFKAWLAF